MSLVTQGLSTHGTMVTQGLGARLLVTGITFTGIPSGFSAGSMQFAGLQFTGLPSGEVVGALDLTSIQYTGIASAQAIGTLTLTITGDEESHVLIFDVVCDLCTDVVE